MSRSFIAFAASVAVLAAVPLPLSGQYFGRNKVQYDDFRFRVLQTEHFDIHYYEREAEAIADLARMSERWYERFGRLFQHAFESRKPLIIYADHPDFQQTNTLQGFISESTGGVTESLKNRVIMPMTGSYWDTDHVLGHELIHAFQYNISQSRRAGGIQSLGRLPLWLIEGMAEYLSVGREDPLTAMWLRDAIRRDDFPTIRQLTEDRRFFPYRFGQALWAYVGGTYGDEAVTDIFRRSLRSGFHTAIRGVTGLSTDTLSERWKRRVEQQFIPLMTGRTDAPDLGRRLISEESGGGTQNISPAISPDGQYIAFLSERDLFSIDLFLADANTGRVIRKLASADSDPHVDALRYTEAAGAWSPDSRLFAHVVFEGGDNSIVVVNARNGSTERRIKPAGIGAINHPTWSPDGRYIAFTGIVGGISDLYMFDLEENTLTQLTNDKYADFHPEWSPDGSTLAFSTDRGPETDFQTLVYSEFQLALLDIETRRVEVLDIFGNARHSNPQYGPDGRGIYFLSDQDGFADIYRLDLASRDVRRLTRVVTGVSGITRHSPALSVADDVGTIAFSVFSDGFTIHTLPSESSGPVETTVVADADIRGRNLPPAQPEGFSRIASYLDDPITGLPPEGVYMPSEADRYESSLSLDFIGQPQIGVGADRFGNYVGGGASAFFSDMLGNRLLGVAVQAQGSFKDVGGAVQYADLGDRWNWGVNVSRIPFLLQGFRTGVNEQDEEFVGQVRQRIFISNLNGLVAYPLSSTRRFEFSGGVVRYSYDLEEDRFIFSPDGTRIVDVERVQIDDECTPDDTDDPGDILQGFGLCVPDAVNLAQVSAAYVGDNSFSAFVGPVRGGRFRFEVQQTVGTETFTQLLGDWRRYLQPKRELTIALRGMHLGRYGGSLADNNQLTGGRRVTGSVIQPFFLGLEQLVRGYAWESFDSEECTASITPGNQSGCPVLERMFGHKVAVASLEFRVPLFGIEQFGLVNFPFLPTEVLLFQDAGLAWTDPDDVSLEFSRSASERVPIFSSGVSARTNILGILVFESYYAYPWQRPDRGWHWGFQIAPAW